MSIRGFYEPVFGYTVIGVKCPHKDAHRHIRKRLSREKDMLAVFDREYPASQLQNAGGCTMPMLPECLVIVWLNSENDQTASDVIAHESFHVSDLILRFCGVRLCDESSETFAHYVGWVAKELSQL